MNAKTIDLSLILPSEHEECERCLTSLQEHLLMVKGILGVKLDREANRLHLMYDPNYGSVEWVQAQAREAGLRLAENIQHQTIDVLGLDCPDCALGLERSIRNLDGVLWTSVNFASAKMHVEFESETIGLATVADVIRELGYDVADAEGLPRAEGWARLWLRSGRRALTAVSGALLLAGFGVSLVNPVASTALYGAAALTGGYTAARNGLASLRRSLSFDMNVLMSVAVIGAIAIDQWAEAATVAFLFSLGNTLESITMDRTRNSIRSLMNLFPKEAVVRRRGEERTVPLESVHVGDWLAVRPGERIAMDGLVLEGTSAVDESPITGESVPVPKDRGNKVYAGSINGRGFLGVRVTAVSDDTTLAKVIHLVEEAQAKRAPSQQFIERFAAYYTPSVIGLAVLVASVPPLVFGAPFVDWFYRALILLVIACPCALVISTPVSIVAALGNAARRGVLVKGGAFLEETGRLRAIAFDKTGTLTDGKLVVTDVVPLNGTSREQLLGLAAAVEARSEHPLAGAILTHTGEAGIAAPSPTQFEALTGMGARATVDGEAYFVGNTRLFADLGTPLNGTEEVVNDLQDQGKTAIVVGTEHTVLGVLAAADQPRPGAAEALARLRDEGIEHLVLLTGDNERTARAIARRLGLDEYRAELLPEDKVAAVLELREEYGRIGVVGDGINDAPALATSNVGFAMGVAGTDVAMETADVALMSDDLSTIPYATHLSRRTVATIKQNVALSLIIKFGFIALAFPGFLTLWLAVLGDTGVSLLVTANGMRLLRLRRAARLRAEAA